MDAQLLLDEIGITVNKNAIPFDPTSPQITSGIRLGTPAITTRGMGPSEMIEIARIISQALKNPQDSTLIKLLSDEVKEITSGFILYERKIQ